jgi:hypothetical protein
VVLGLATVLWCASLGDVTRGRLFALAACVGVLANLFKPGVLIWFVAAAYSVAAIQSGALDRWRLLRLVALIGLSTVPAALYGIFVIGSQVGDKVLPDLLLTEHFYRGWVDNVLRAAGFVPLLAAACGYLLARSIRTVGVQHALSYLANSATYTRHTMTHDNYQVPLLVIVAIGLGGLGARLAGIVRTRRPSLSAAAAAGVAAAIALTYLMAPANLREPYPPGQYEGEGIYARIGQLLPPGESVLAFSPNYGKSLMYATKLVVTNWPHSDQEAYQRALGWPEVAIATELDQFMRSAHPRYFIYTGPIDVDRPLVDFLAARYRAFADEPGFRIYNLTEPRRLP